MPVEQNLTSTIYLSDSHRYYLRVRSQATNYFKVAKVPASTRRGHGLDDRRLTYRERQCPAKRPCQPQSSMQDLHESLADFQGGIELLVANYASVGLGPGTWATKLFGRS
jgi:hypothetical protein